MKQQTNIVWFLLGCLLFTGCAYRKAAKQAAKYEQAKMYSAAIDKYLYSLSKKGDYIDARIGLMRTLTIYKEQLVEKIEEGYEALNDDAVVDNYLALDNLRKKAAPYQVEIAIDSRTQGQYAEAKNRFLVTHYKKAQHYIEEENFSEAQTLLESIIKVESGYENAHELLITCKCEPLYRSGKSSLNNQKYRTAYAAFQQILNINASYKDTKELQTESLEKGILTIAFTSMKNQSRYPTFCNSIINDTKQAIQKANNPFVKIVDLNNTEQMLAEQRRALQYGLELKAGAIIPVRAHLSCAVESFTLTTTPLQVVKKKGFIKETKSDKTVVYHKVYYKEYSRSQTCQCSFLYDLRSVETGIILVSGSSTPTSTDKIHYAYCEGQNNSNLYSGTWENQKSAFDANTDKVNDSFIAKLAMKSLVYGRQELKSENEMRQQLINTIVKDMSNKILKYNPE